MQDFNRRHPGLIYKVAFLFAFAVVFTFLALRLPKNSQAASLANFRPGNIISDYTMSNYETMTVEEIDKFLHDHGNCNNREIYKADWYPSVHYHVKDGHFVCLADEVFAEGVEYGDLIPEGTKYRTAAQVIYDTAHEFKINPQVLLVLLEKEQGLISDSWPNSLQYRSATGFGCPDTAPCNQLYYGFVNQLDNAAYLFRTVLDGGWTNYPVGNNYIRYNPNASCGGSTVYVENLATSSLYRYTPYQPNQAALDAGYGTTYCGAYGNRNFYLFFMDWFGDPTSEGEKPTEAQLKATEEIEARYKKLTDAKNLLGSKTTKYPNCDIGYEGACVQAFEKGVIISNPSTGTWENYGEIRNRFAKLGSVDSVLGFPISKINCSIGYDDTCVQAFENGVIIQTKKYGAIENTGKIRERFIELGSVDGTLGFPIATTNCDIGHNGACVQAFENGVIISNPSTGTWENYGEIRRRFINNGSIDGHFGFPITGIVCDEDGGCYQDFEERAIFEDSKGNYWISEGEIASRYQEVDEILGSATANINCNIGYEGACVQAFENGVIISSPETGTWESYGDIRKQHILSGSIDGELGFPTSGIEIDETTGRLIQKFKNGELSTD